MMKKLSSKEEQAAKEKAGKLMKDEDDKKEDLSKAIWATMHKTGGPLAWVAIVLSFFVT